MKELTVSVYFFSFVTLVCLLFLQNNNNVSSKDFHQKIWFMMIYQLEDVSLF